MRMTAAKVEINFREITSLLETSCEDLPADLNLHLRECGQGKVVESARSPSGLVIRTKVLSLFPLMKFLIAFSEPLHRSGERFTLIVLARGKVFEIKEGGSIDLRRKTVAGRRRNLFLEGESEISLFAGAPPRNPQYKALVESFFSSLNRRFLFDLLLNEIRPPSLTALPDDDGTHTRRPPDILDDFTPPCLTESRQKRSRSTRTLPVIREKKWTH